jgi:hypothetical protein
MQNEGANLEATKKMFANDEDDDQDEKEDEILDEFIDEFDKKKSNAVTREFEVFLEATKNDASQVVRYCHAGNLPLWSSNKYKLKKSEVPECENCGDKMTFELQLMPALYNYINELANLNWSSVMIYTCQNSCNPGGEHEYVEEYAYAEMVDEDEMKMDIQDTQALMEAMKHSKKPTKGKNVKGKGKPKAGLDAETEAKIKKQLDELQLDLE